MIHLYFKAIDMNSKISNIIKTVLLVISCLVAVGCSNDDLNSPDSPDDVNTKVVLTFSTSPTLITRTVLPGLENLQHVETMQLYIFNGTGNNAMCVASEKVDWTDLAAPEGKPTVSKMHKVIYNNFEPGKPYTFIAVGMDNCSGATFALPDAVQVGKTLLGAAKAVLDSGKTKSDIAVSELFGGAAVITPLEVGKVTGTIDLFRRVAGVMGWFTNIPRQVNGTNVAYLRIELFKAQNKSIWLTKPNSAEDVIMEPIAENDVNKVLVEIKLEEKDFAPGAVVSKGAYVLPMIAPFKTADEMIKAGYNDEAIYVKDYTFQVVLADANGTVLQARKVRNSDIVQNGGTEGGTGIIETNSAYRFPINANWFYPIGSKDKPAEWSNEKKSNFTVKAVPVR